MQILVQVQALLPLVLEALLLLVLEVLLPLVLEVLLPLALLLLVLAPLQELQFFLRIRTAGLQK